MLDIYERFDKEIDVKGLADDVKEAADKGSGDFPEVPFGKYEVSIDTLELVESKKGDPMVKCWFRIISGKFKNSMIFYYQVVSQGFQIHIMNEFLRSLETGIDIEFTSYKQYSQLLLDVAEEMDGCGVVLDYDENRKGFNTYKVEEVFDIEPV